MPEARRVLRAAAVTAAVLTAFAAGVTLGAFQGGDSAASRTDADDPSHGILDEAVDRIAAEAAYPVDPERLRRAAIEAMLAQTRDRWAAFYSPQDHDELRALLAGHYGGLGLWLRRTADGKVRVVGVAPGSPAARGGVRAADELLTVAGRPTAGRDVAEVVTDLRGAAGTPVLLELRTGAAPARQVRLVRAEVPVEDVSARWLRPGVALVRVSAFTRGVAGQLRAALARFRAQRADGVVLDLRGDPGGLLDEAVEAAGAFLDGGPVVSYSGRATPPRTLSAPRHGDTTTPLVVLVDGGTASAAEVLAGALQDRGRAVVVGSRTFGKGSVQEAFPLPEGSAVELTVASYRTPRGRSLDGVGLVPDVTVPPSAGEAVGLSRARDVVVGLATAARHGTSAG
ncbi:MAG TPA: S41 family peptidase [Frankiaceae bacterium]|nr:S41 family peptidase [Frankiaceae bacterium]